MNIHMLTATHPDSDTGGGGLHARELIRIGEQIGHRITICTELDKLPNTGPDLYWLANMCGKFPISDVMDRVGHTRYIVHEDAYSSLCPQPTREYKLCFQGQDPYDIVITDAQRGPLYYRDDVDTSCQGHNDPTYSECSSICRYHELIPLLHNCKAMVVDSPMHGKIWAGLFPILEDKLVILDPPIPVSKFSVGDRKVPNTYSYVGTIAKGKGFDNCVQFVRNRGGQLIAVGDIHHTIDMNQYSDVQYYGSVSYDTVANIIRNAQYLIHLPDWPEPQGRIITEGLLCGCTVIGNRRIGALSYDWLSTCVDIREEELPDAKVILATVKDNQIDKFRSIISAAPYKFWRDIDDYYNN